MSSSDPLCGYDEVIPIPDSPLRVNVGGRDFWVGSKMVKRTGVLSAAKSGALLKPPLSSIDVRCLKNCPHDLPGGRRLFLDMDAAAFEAVVAFMRSMFLPMQRLNSMTSIFEFLRTIKQLNIDVDPQRCYRCQGVFDCKTAESCFYHKGSVVALRGRAARWSCCGRRCARIDSDGSFQSVLGCTVGAHVDERFYEQERPIDYKTEYTADMDSGLLGAMTHVMRDRRHLVSNGKGLATFCQIGVDPQPYLCDVCPVSKSQGGTCDGNLKADELPRKNRVTSVKSGEGPSFSAGAQRLLDILVLASETRCLDKLQEPVRDYLDQLNQRLQDPPYFQVVVQSCWKAQDPCEQLLNESSAVIYILVRIARDRGLHSVHLEVMELIRALHHDVNVPFGPFRSSADFLCSGVTRTWVNMRLGKAGDCTSLGLTKTVICPLFKLLHKCPLGEVCTYAHAGDKYKFKPTMYKTKICFFWERGICKRKEACNHAHGSHELRQSLERMLV